MELLLLSINYVTSDPFFWVAMATTTIIGIFIGAVVYDGLLNQVRKAIVTLLAYMFLVMATDLARIFPIISGGFFINPHQPLAAVTTMSFVTIFYLLGMWVGVFITNKAHGGYPSTVPPKVLH